MFARNPFEKVVTMDGPALDMPRQQPRDLMADAFLSELMDRLMRGGQHGYMPGLTPDYRGHGRGYEHNGFPTGPGLRNTAHTYPAMNNHPIRMNPFALGPRGQAFGGDMRINPMLEVPDEFADDSEFADDPFDPLAGSGLDQFSLDALPYAGSDGDDGVAPSPFELGPARTLPTVPVPQADPGLEALRRAIRPGYAELSTFGYSEPNTDPYAENLTALLRRLVRQA